MVNKNVMGRCKTNEVLVGEERRKGWDVKKYPPFVFTSP
jgi:hypothetical protein